MVELFEEYLGITKTWDEVKNLFAEMLKVTHPIIKHLSDCIANKSLSDMEFAMWFRKLEEVMAIIGLINYRMGHRIYQVEEYGNCSSLNKS